MALLLNEYALLGDQTTYNADHYLNTVNSICNDIACSDIPDVTIGDRWSRPGPYIIKYIQLRL